MENQNYKIDEIFRQRLHDAEVPPPPFVWPAVEQELQKQRRRKLFLWLFTFGTVLACAWLWHASPWKDANPVQPIAPSAELPMEVQDNNLNASPGATEINSRVAGNDPISKEPSATKADDLTRNAQPVSKGRSSVGPGKENQASEILTSQAEVSDQQTISPVTAKTEQSGITPQALILDKSLEIIGVQSVASLSDQREHISPKSVKSHARRKKLQPKLCYDFARHPSAWLLDVYFGPSLAQRSLTSRLEDEPYLNQRLATEQRSVAMNAGVRASLMFNSNFLVRTGLHYDQVTEVFEYIDPTTVIYRLQFTPGNPIPDTLGVEYGENYLKTYNRYGMLDVPLMVGVEMRRGRSGLSVNAGITANVLFHKRGAIIDPLTHEPARFGAFPDDPKSSGPKTSLSQEAFRTNVGVSAMASIQWYWHLNPHFRLFAEPSFRQVLRPVTLGNHPVEQRYSILGLRLGATKIF